MLKRTLLAAAAGIIALSVAPGLPSARPIMPYPLAPVSAGEQEDALQLVRTHRKTVSNQTAAVQRALNAKGYRVAVDGKSGPATRAALRDFQAREGLKRTGAADSRTLRALGVG